MYGSLIAIPFKLKVDNCLQTYEKESYRVSFLVYSIFPCLDMLALFNLDSTMVQCVCSNDYAICKDLGYSHFYDHGTCFSVMAFSTRQ